MSIHSVKMNMIDQTLFKIEEKQEINEIETFCENDCISASFSLFPLTISNDTGEYGDILIEWSRLLDNQPIKTICKLPIQPVSIVSSPVSVEHIC